MTTIEQARPLWLDNGTAHWPPEGWHGLREDDWPYVAEAWEKFGDEAQRREIHDRKNLLRCAHRTWLDHEHFVPGGPSYRYCKAEGIGERWAREHGLAAHPGEATSFNYVNARWVYEMMGMEDFYDGKPRGWYCVLDGSDPRDARWEADALLLGTAVADYLRNP